MSYVTVTDCYTIWYDVTWYSHKSQSHNHISQKDIEEYRIMISYYILIVYSTHVL